MISGYYKLTHLPTGLFYVGSSQNLSKRISNHRSDLIRGINSNKRFQQVYTTWDDILVEQYQTNDLSEARKGEQRFLDRYVGDSLCCNVGHSSTDPTAGIITTEIRRVQMATINKNQVGKALSHSQRASISSGLTGTPRSTEAKMAISLGKSRKVTIDGNVYDSVTLAAMDLNLTAQTIRYRIGSNSTKYANWKFI